jgi:hypothetical protein
LAVELKITYKLGSENSFTSFSVMIVLKILGCTVGIILASAVWLHYHFAKPGTSWVSAASVQSLRSEQSQRHYRVQLERLDQYYASLVSALKVDKQTDLLANLEAPKELRFGYQILPKIDHHKALHEQRARVVGYSWAWTDKLIDDATQAIADSQIALDRTLKLDPNTRRQSYQQLAVRYVQLRDAMRNIDAHVKYNRFWQSAFADSHERLQRKTSNNAWARNINAVAELDPPEFISLERRFGYWFIHVPLYTDIQDRDFLKLVKENIETVWRLRVADDEFRVQVDLAIISPAELYKSEIPQAGSELVLDRHLALFPRNGAILTTGARTTHVLARAIILGPENLSGRILAHEMGHILGFRDSYERNYKDFGEGGYEITETVGDSNDIMSNPATGTVLPRHFHRLIEQLKVRPALRPVHHEISSTDRGANKNTAHSRSVELSATSMRVASA